jgi:hypothetical protein
MSGVVGPALSSSSLCGGGARCRGHLYVPWIVKRQQRALRSSTYRPRPPGCPTASRSSGSLPGSPLASFDHRSNDQRCSMNTVDTRVQRLSDISGNLWEQHLGNPSSSRRSRKSMASSSRNSNSNNRSTASNVPENNTMSSYRPYKPPSTLSDGRLLDKYQPSPVVQHATRSPPPPNNRRVKVTSLLSSHAPSSDADFRARKMEEVLSEQRLASLQKLSNEYRPDITVSPECSRLAGLCHNEIVVAAGSAGWRSTVESGHHFRVCKCRPRLCSKDRSKSLPLRHCNRPFH